MAVANLENFPPLPPPPSTVNKIENYFGILVKTSKVVDQREVSFPKVSWHAKNINIAQHYSHGSGVCLRSFYIHKFLMSPLTWHNCHRRGTSRSTEEALFSFASAPTSLPCWSEPLSPLGESCREKTEPFEDASKDCCSYWKSTLKLHKNSQSVILYIQ